MNRRALLGMAAAWALSGAVGPATAAPRQFDGLIEPWQTVEIRSPVTGLIERVHVARGQAVKRGAVLVSLESSVERAAAELARYRSSMEGAVHAGEGRLQHAERKFKRRSELADKNYLTVQEREDAEAEQRIAQGDLQAARENRQVAKLEHDHATAQLGLRQLRSPIDGVVVEQSAWPGELAEPGSSNRAAILKLAQVHPLKVTVILPAALYPRIKPGMKAEVQPEMFEGALATTVSVMDKVIDAASGTFKVQLTLNNEKGSLPGGIRCKVTFSELQ
jgi:RND family efflux transporter MFP subunit